ncbi:MAG: single-stranded-DNA-specific exonuclease RecJ, partial [Actinomycetia bacterium]|nr:single-stranded-DNA-specific exonuclease RecJ [Actinomycetes bacterium]
GIISSVLVYNFLKSLNIETDIYIPDRTDEGYDLGIDFIKKVSGSIDLIISVDCGTNNTRSQGYIRDNQDGPDVIACDHHNPTLKDYPDNDKYIIINPKMPGSKYPFKNLSGGGVTFKFLIAVLRSLDSKQKNIFNKDYLGSLLDLVAVSTIADVMPLIDENRILVKKGLEKIQNTSNTGLKALIDIAVPDGGIIGEYDIGFNIAPRLNAAGRVGTAIDSFKLLSDDDTDNIYIANCLDSFNRERRDIQKKILDEILLQYDFNEIISQKRIFIAKSNDWNEGVLGIVASGIVKKFNLPAILFRERNGILKGSGRSIPQFDLHGNLMQLEDLFIKFGGHKLACGISMDPQNFSEFYEKMSAIANRRISSEELVKKYEYDIEIGFQDIDIRFLEDLCLLRPNGLGNPRPAFITRDCDVIEVKQLKNGKHAKIRLKNNNRIFDGLIFNIDDSKKKILSDKKKIDILYDLQLNTWNNIVSIQIIIKDIF